MFLTWLLNSIAVYVAASILNGVEIKNFWSAVAVVAVLALVNILIKPILLLLSLPFTILTFGLFVWIVDAALIMLVDALIKGFKVKNFGWALLFGIVMSVLNWGLVALLG